MSRRGHLSHKVPNVKLRPAPAPGSNDPARKMRQLSPDMWKETYGYGQDEDESGPVETGESSKPWQDVVITITGQEDKVHLSSLIRELGGTVESALTVRVTHVIASAHNSAKYVYAVEHRIPVMTPEWVLHSHSRYIHAEDVNLDDDMDRFRLLPFIGLTIAMSGIEPLDRRRQIVQYINDNGGIYNKDLGRGCTHLIAAKGTTEPGQSEKIKWAVKENLDRQRKRKKWKVQSDDINIVYEEWIWDCVGFRGRFPEAKYDASQPRPKAKVEAENVLDGTAFKEVKADAVPLDQKEEELPAVVRKRKGATGGPAAGEMAAVILSCAKKPKMDTKRAENDDTEQGFSVQTNGAEVGTSTKTAAASVAEVDRDELRDDTRWNHHSRAVEQERKPSVLTMPRTSSFAPSSALAGPSKITMAQMSTTNQIEASTADPPKTGEVPIATPRIFDGLRFSHVIQENCESLEKALVGHGGMLVSETERLAGAQVDYIIVRLNSSIRPEISSSPNQPTLVTECWIEGCCFERRMVSPDDHLVFRPLPATLPIRGANDFNIHLSGFSTSETVYLKRLLRALGARHSLKVSRETTHLVSPILKSRKVDICLEWGIPVVKDSWLFTMGKSGVMESHESHTLVGPLTPGQRTSNALMSEMFGTPDVDLDFSGIKSSTPKAAFLNKAAEVKPSSSSPMSVISQNRLLKLTPTHIDGMDGGVRSAGSSDSMAESLPLSAPGPERERALNKASSAFEIKNDTVESKLSRTSSAPPIGSIKETAPEAAKRSPSVGGSPAGVGPGTGMTEVLRQMASKGDVTPRDRTKSIRRPRTGTGSRLKVRHSFFPAEYTS
ncbi:hypothetical protein BD324DRAFT_233372 [Kockovaella imperatae]|uniref:BRCT domain-containing protein n=1 Tax=Kockovaella imperatae TaxID=4999 RepID=A0A1Y1UP27_9TREE|nr:hypothetical protein BD324DRAFT_233372 [Kockovaella imperatae]ORX39769.1 hypothetical protein BD324DRAFT_233372 [Kockovaella imperatae]